QAEDGIRDRTVTGVQTCALPIWSHADLRPARNLDRFIGQRSRFAILKFNRSRGNVVVSRRAVMERERESLKGETLKVLEEGVIQIGRASCRERVWRSGGAVAVDE